MSASRHELATFLRAARTRADPREMGITVAARRRTRGLRREEVSALAGISTTWYTWLEQGRPVQASAQALQAIGRALRLNPAEMTYLFQIGRGESPPTRPAQPPPCSSALQRRVERIAVPAFLIDSAWTVLAANTQARLVLGLPAGTVNLVRHGFGAPARRQVVEWRRFARDLVGEVRLAHSRERDNAALERLIEHMRQDVDFAWWWNAEVVSDLPVASRRFDHDVLGRLEFTVVRVAEPMGSGLTLVVYLPSGQDTDLRWRSAAARRLGGIPTRISPGSDRINRGQQQTD